MESARSEVEATNDGTQLGSGVLQAATRVIHRILHVEPKTTVWSEDEAALEQRIQAVKSKVQPLMLHEHATLQRKMQMVERIQVLNDSIDSMSRELPDALVVPPPPVEYTPGQQHVDEAWSSGHPQWWLKSYPQPSSPPASPPEPPASNPTALANSTDGVGPTVMSPLTLAFQDASLEKAYRSEVVQRHAGKQGIVMNSAVLAIYLTFIGGGSATEPGDARHPVPVSPSLLPPL